MFNNEERQEWVDAYKEFPSAMLICNHSQTNLVTDLFLAELSAPIIASMIDGIESITNIKNNYGKSASPSIRWDLQDEVYCMIGNETEHLFYDMVEEDFDLPSAPPCIINLENDPEWAMIRDSLRETFKNDNASFEVGEWITSYAELLPLGVVFAIAYCDMVDVDGSEPEEVIESEFVPIEKLKELLKTQQELEEKAGNLNAQ